MPKTPTDRDNLMSSIAETFPTLNGAPGVRPFDPTRLKRWAREGGHGSGSIHAFRFVMEVAREHHALGAFDVVKAVGTWDQAHRAALAAWVAKGFV